MVSPILSLAQKRNDWNWDMAFLVFRRWTLVNLDRRHGSSFLGPRCLEAGTFLRAHTKVKLKVGICLGRRDVSQPRNHHRKDIVKIVSQMLLVLCVFSLCPPSKYLLKYELHESRGIICFIHSCMSN